MSCVICVIGVIRVIGVLRVMGKAIWCLGRGYDGVRGLAFGYGHTHQNTPDLV